jgi:hypothetical protein
LNKRGKIVSSDRTVFLFGQGLKKGCILGIQATILIQLTGSDCLIKVVTFLTPID